MGSFKTIVFLMGFSAHMAGCTQSAPLAKLDSPVPEIPVSKAGLSESTAAVSKAADFPKKMTRQEFMEASQDKARMGELIKSRLTSKDAVAVSEARQMMSNYEALELLTQGEISQSTVGYFQWVLALLEDGTFRLMLKVIDRRGAVTDYNRLTGNWKYDDSSIRFSEQKEGEGLPAMEMSGQLVLDEAGEPALAVRFSKDITTGVGQHLIPLANRVMVLKYLPGQVDATL